MYCRHSRYTLQPCCLHLTPFALQVQELQGNLQHRTAELSSANAEASLANEKLHTLRGETAALQQWQQTVQAERASEAEAVRQAKQVSAAGQVTGSSL